MRLSILRSLLVALVGAVSVLMAVGSPARAQTTCGNWLPGPRTPDFGIAGSVNAMVVYNGELYASAGLYNAATNTSTVGVFVLRSGLWTPVPWNASGFGDIKVFNADSGVPTALTERVISTTASTRTVEYAVRTFDGTAWQTPASMQLTNPIGQSVGSFDCTLYSGQWYIAMGNNANGFLYRLGAGTGTLLATTDTASCTSLPFGGCVILDPRSIRVLQVGPGGLYFGGRFNSITPTGGSVLNATNLALYNGTSFSAFTAQPNGAVTGMLNNSTIQVNSAGLLVWGNFTQVGTLAASSIARYASFTNTWSALGTGLNSPPAAVIQTGGQTTGPFVYVVVGTTPPSVASAWGCARWINGAWENFGGADADTALWNPSNFTCAVNFGGIVVGGSNLTVGTSQRYGVSRWTGTAWDYVASQQGTDGYSRATAVHNGEVYFAGDFTRIDSVSASHVAKRSNATGAYEPLGAGVNGQGLAMISFGGELILGGTFTSAGGNAASNVAAWNGTSWRALGAGLDGAVRGFTIWNGSLVAVGSFRNSGATATGNAARWNGTAWVPIDATLTNSDLYAASTLGSTLYVGGVPGLRRFNGTTFDIPGGNVAGTVYALLPLFGQLYVAGDFPTVGSPALGYKRLAKWNGTAWSPVGPNAPADFTSGSIRSLSATADEVFAFGEFNVVALGGTSFATNAARFDGTAWRKLDTQQISGRPLASSILGDRVWVAGEFTNVGAGTIIYGQGVLSWSKNPVFTLNPTSQALCGVTPSSVAQFSVATFGTPAPSLRWYKAGTPVSDNLRISGATTSTLTIGGLIPSDAGLYWCVATDTCGGTAISTSATLSLGCSQVADVASLGGVPGCDGRLTADDIVLFLSSFFALQPIGDVAGLGGSIGPDGRWTADDVVAFLTAFFNGCP